jgi:hypothetical protein
MKQQTLYIQNNFCTNEKEITEKFFFHHKS